MFLETIRTSGANRNSKLRNSEFVQIPIWNLDVQRRIVSDKFGQSLNSDMPLKILPNLSEMLPSPKIWLCLTHQSGTEKYDKNVGKIVAQNLLQEKIMLYTCKYNSQVRTML